MLKDKLHNVLIAYFDAKGHPFRVDEPAHHIVWRVNLRSAREVLRLAGDDDGAAIRRIREVATWAKDRKLDWTLATVSRRWLERHDPKEKKPFYLENGREYPARQEEEQWKAKINGQWVTLNRQYLNLKECIVWK
jgi:hypothetical protein